MLRNINDFDQVDDPWLGTSTNVRTNCSQIHPASADSAPADYPSFDELALRIAVAFRQHGHIGNVLTHICGRDWTGLEHDLCRILDPKSVGAELSPLARNVLELLCANRGVTGPIMRQYFHRRLIAILGRDAAARFVHQIDIAFAKSASARRQLLGAGPIISQRQQSQESE